MAEDIHKSFARQQQIRRAIARDAGILARRLEQVRAAGMEPATVEAVETAYKALASRGEVTPFQPKPRHREQGVA